MSYFGIFKMQTYANTLLRFSYGQHDLKDNGPFQRLIKILMKQKATYLYRNKQVLIKLQLQLIQSANAIRAHAADTEKSRILLEDLKTLQAKAQHYIQKVNEMETEFNSHSEQQLAQAKTKMPIALKNFISQIESDSGNTLSEDLKGLLFDSNGLPISGEKLTALLKERGL